MPRKWKNIKKQNIQLKRKSKNIRELGNTFSTDVEPGTFIDPLNGNLVVIEEAKSSTLRRYYKKLDKYYHLVDSQNDRTFIQKQQKEIEHILNNREDGWI